MKLHSNIIAAEALLAGLAVLGCAGCGTPAESPPAQPAASGPRSVETVSTASQDMVRKLTQPATLEGIEQTVLYARTAGYLQAIYVDRGDRVKAGQVLAVIESPDTTAQTGQARSALMRARSSVGQMNATRGKAGADVQSAAATVEKARAELLQAEAGVARAEADLLRSRAQIGRTESLTKEAQNAVSEAEAARAQAQSELQRQERLLTSMRSTGRAVQAALEGAQSEARLQTSTHARLKGIQDRDAGLIAAQQVDEARTRMETASRAVDAARARADANRADLDAAEQQVDGARKAILLAERKIDGARRRVETADKDVLVGRADIAAGEKQLGIAQALREAARKQIAVTQAVQRSQGEQVRIASSQVDVAKQDAAGARIALNAARSMERYTRLTAPFDGVVTERMADPGALIQNASGNQASARGILKIVNDRSLRVQLSVPEKEAPRVRTGAPVEIELEAFPKDKISGTVSRTNQVIDPKSRTMFAEVLLPNPGSKLRPGMYARVTLTLEVHPGALVVPTAALIGKEDRFLYRVEGGKAVKTPVKVGLDDGKLAEILEGLKPGSQVVVVGMDSLVDGAAVTAKPFQPEPAKK